jgi:hypothetical protein
LWPPRAHAFVEHVGIGGAGKGKHRVPISSTPGPGVHGIPGPAPVCKGPCMSAEQEHPRWGRAGLVCGIEQGPECGGRRGQSFLSYFLAVIFWLGFWFWWEHPGAELGRFPNAQNWPT